MWQALSFSSIALVLDKVWVLLKCSLYSRHHMAGEWLAYGELGLAAVGFAPFAIHHLSCNSWANQKLECPEELSGLEMTLLLPVWNEELIIEKKLSNLAKQDFKAHLVLVDSASNDSTLSKAKSWLEDFPDAFESWKIIPMQKRLGKTTAVGLALDELEGNEGIIVMTDADATIMQGALTRINRWFSNPQIGAVGGSPIREGSIAGETNHREIYTRLRVGESHHDSTPFLEGSLLAWRAGIVSSSDLHYSANADDAQIATAARLNGLRSIQDPNLAFSDQMPLTNKGQRRQKVRRAQGLIRLLARKRKHWFSKREGRFSKILRRNAWMHILSPIAIASAAVLAVMRNIAYFPESTLMFSLSAMEVYCLTSWLLARFNKSFFGFRTAGVIMCGLENLLVAMIHTGRGKSLHMWEQHTDVRKALSER
jgi:glycosyltransferase involved in cell wall biosynthesis